MNVLVVAAHPDDEILGCGATLARHAAEGDHVHIMIMAEGLTSRDKQRDSTQHQDGFSELARAANKAKTIVGAQTVELLSFPDNRMDSVDLLDVVKEIEVRIQKYKPETIYTHFRGDLNIDHQIIHKAVLTACRPLSTPFVKQVLVFEVQSSTEWSVEEKFHPNYFVDVSKYIDKKIEALKAYQSEMRPWPHPRSFEAVEHLARWRGASSGSEAAEAFYLVRGTR